MSELKFRELNHVAVHVADVEISCRFYRDVLRLESIPRPAFDFPGAWFRLGARQELHIIGDRQLPVHSHNRGNHFALLTEEVAPWEAHLKQSGYPHRSKLRPDGAHQIFLADPDGHVIEICSPPPS